MEVRHLAISGDNAFFTYTQCWHLINLLICMGSHFNIYLHYLLWDISNYFEVSLIPLKINPIVLVILPYELEISLIQLSGSVSLGSWGVSYSVSMFSICCVSSVSYWNVLCCFYGLDMCLFSPVGSSYVMLLWVLCIWHIVSMDS